MNKHIVAIVIVISSLGFIATDIYLPSLPAMGEYFAVANTVVQLSISVFLFSLAVSPLFFGPYSDVIGRRKVLLVGMFMTIFSTLLIIFAPNIWIVIFARFIQGIALGAINVAGRAILPDVFTGNELAQNNAIVNMLMPALLSIAPIFGGIIQSHFGWRAVFICFLCYVLLAAIFVNKYFTETIVVKTQGLGFDFKAYWRLTRNKQFFLFGLVPALGMMGISSYITASPYLFQVKLGLSPQEYGSLYFIVASTIFISGWLNTKAMQYFSHKNLLAASGILILLSGIVLSLLPLHNIWCLIIPSIGFFFALNFAFSNAYPIAIAAIDGNFATAAALVTSIQMAAGSIASTVIAILPETNAKPLSIIFMICGLAIFLIAKVNLDSYHDPEKSNNG